MLLIDIAAAPDLPVLKASRRDINRNLFVGIGGTENARCGLLSWYSYVIF